MKIYDQKGMHVAKISVMFTPDDEVKWRVDDRWDLGSKMPRFYGSLESAIEFTHRRFK
jgi:hypothetical protein